MPSHNDPLQPTPFDIVKPASPSTSTERNPDVAVSRGTPAWVLPALGGLILLALLVIFWLPKSLESAKNAPAPTAAETADTAASGQPDSVSGKPSPTGADASPWSDAQMARLRKEAQEVLAQLLELQDTLQTRGVEQWAAEAFTEVATLAVDGDALYKTRQYEQATVKYQQALTALQTLHDDMPGELKRLLGSAQQSIEKGDASTALAELAMAALIDPNSSDIASLQQRAKLLPQVLPLLEQAAAAETDGDLSQAQQLLQQAATLDPLHQRARSELQRIMEKVRSQDFNKAMSAGYSALNEARFDSANKAFRTAAALQVNSSEAASALQQVATAQTAQRLGTLNQRGQKNEQQEQWQKAVDYYEQAQKLDSSILFAREGLQRSRDRAALDQKLRNTIEAPQRLSDAAVAIDAAKQLQQAKQYTPRGPVLTRQIDRLETLLQQAKTTVTITLLSDGKTDVKVYPIADREPFVERFVEHQLSLKPGTYKAKGIRNGYHEVLQHFTIAHDSAPAPVTIICTKPI